MRRLGVLIVALALIIPAAGLALVSLCGPVALGRATVALLDAVGPPQVAAQVQTLPFKSLPPESVSTLERERSGRRRVRVSVDVPEVPAAPEVPDVSEAPKVSEPPDVTEHVTRSGDITRVSNDIHIERDEIVRGDVTAIRGDITVDGTVHGGVVSFGGDIYLNPTARVDGDVVCIGGELHEEPGAYVSGQRVTALGGRGESLARRLHVRPSRGDWDWGWGGLRLFGALLRLLVAAGLTLLIAWLFQGRIAIGAETLRRQPALSLGIGALVLALAIHSVVALALIMALLCITIVGIPLALAALVGYALFFLVFWLFGLVVGATVIGQHITARRGAPPVPVWQSAVLGVVLVLGIRFFGRVLQTLGVAGLHGLGTLVIVLTVLAAAVMGTIGGGAWLKWEFTEGLFGQWRGRWEGRSAARTATVPPASYGPPPASPYGPPAAAEPPAAPAAPAPPETYMPPGEPQPPGPPPTA